MTPAAAIANAQRSTQAALAARHPGRISLSEPGATAVSVSGGVYRGPHEWTDDDGIPQRQQAVTVMALKSAFPATFGETAKGWTFTFESITWRVLSVTPWGASWLVRGVR